MIKVLQVVGSLNYAGIEAVIMNYYRNIDREKVQFDFIATSQGGRFEDEIRAFGGKIFYLPKKSKHPFRYMKQLKKIIEENKYDIVHSNTNSASAYLDLKPAKKAGCRIRIAHSHNSSCIVKWQHTLFRPLLPGVVTHRFACSDMAAEWLFGKNSDCKIINNGIDFDRFAFKEETRNEVRAMQKWEGSFVIGNVASFQERKNQRFLIELMPELLNSIPKAKMVLVGEGDTRKGLEELADSLNVANNVEFLGVRNDVDRLLQGFDVFCFPSFFEGLAVAYIEAIASGLPVIISDRVPYVNIGSRITRISLDKEEWRKAIVEKSLETTFRKPLTEQERVASGYDIKLLAKQLEDYYTRFCLEAMEK